MIGIKIRPIAPAPSRARRCRGGRSRWRSHWDDRLWGAVSVKRMTESGWEAGLALSPCGRELADRTGVALRMSGSGKQAADVAIPLARSRSDSATGRRWVDSQRPGWILVARHVSQARPIKSRSFAIFEDISPHECSMYAGISDRTRLGQVFLAV